MVAVEHDIRISYKARFENHVSADMAMFVDCLARVRQASTIVVGNSRDSTTRFPFITRVISSCTIVSLLLTIHICLVTIC